MTNLNLNRNVFAPYALPYMMDYSHRWECWLGSAGSAKSYSITQKLIIRACAKPIRILVCRRYGTTLRQTVFSLFKEVLTKWQIIDRMKINESDYRITFPNGSEIIFMGLDDETKLLSLNNISTIWIEEAYEVPQPIVEQLNLRMRGQEENQQIIMSWNPISKNHWLYTFCNNPPESYILIHSTYKDNPFLSQEYIKSLEELQTRNPAKWKIYGLGQWGTNPEGLVITNWEIQALDRSNIAMLEHRAGMDIGWIDPSAIVDILYDKTNKIIYVVNEFYKPGQTLDNLLKALRDMHLTKTKVQCDSAEPRTIDFFRRNNINAVPCIKGQNSVSARIAFLQNHKIIVDKSCYNVINELENFSYILDKHTNQYTEDTTHEFSHSIDAIGYALSDLYTHSTMRTMDKSILNL